VREQHRMGLRLVESLSCQSRHQREFGGNVLCRIGVEGTVAFSIPLTIN